MCEFVIQEVVNTEMLQLSYKGVNGKRGESLLDDVTLFCHC